MMNIAGGNRVLSSSSNSHLSCLPQMRQQHHLWDKSPEMIFILNEVYKHSRTEAYKNRLHVSLALVLSSIYLVTHENNCSISFNDVQFVVEHCCDHLHTWHWKPSAFKQPVCPWTAFLPNWSVVQGLYTRVCFESAPTQALNGCLCNHQISSHNYNFKVKFYLQLTSPAAFIWKIPKSGQRTSGLMHGIFYMTKKHWFRPQRTKELQPTVPPLHSSQMQLWQQSAEEPVVPLATTPFNSFSSSMKS